MTDRTDEERFAEHGRQLAAAIDAVIEPWVMRCVTETCAAAGIPVDDRVRDAASDAARRCRREVAAEMAALVAADVDGLLMAGRCISGDFVAHSSYRVTGNAVAMGEAAGHAAALSIRNNVLPHEIDWRGVS